MANLTLSTVKRPVVASGDSFAVYQDGSSRNFPATALVNPDGTPVNFGAIALGPGNTPSYDPFGRFRVSTPQTLFDSKQLFDNQPLVWDDVTTSGAASSTYNTNQASTTLSLSTQTGTRVRQTRRRFNYQPGKGQLILVTFCLGAAVANVTKNVGYFDEKNGLFLQQGPSGTINFVKRSYVSGAAVDVTYAQSAWTEDKMDGTGVSGVNLDFSKTQILFIDFEWLGVGTVRYGFVVDGVIYYAHHVHNANNQATVYMSSPNLPIRYEISSSQNATASLVCICSSVVSEGGLNSIGYQRSVDRGATGLVTNNDTSIYPLIAIRLNSAFLGAFATVTSIAINDTVSNAYRWCLLLNPTVTGTAFSFAQVSNSAIDIDVARTNATTLSGGTQLASGYANGTQDAGLISAPTDMALGSTIAGVSDILVVGFQKITGGSATVYASLQYRELI